MAGLPPYSAPRWVMIAGIVVLVPVLLVGIRMSAGGSLGGYTSPAGGH